MKCIQCFNLTVWTPDLDIILNSCLPEYLLAMIIFLHLAFWFQLKNDLYKQKELALKILGILVQVIWWGSYLTRI